MINEVLYCERLMYLERVQGEWSDNAFEVEGGAVIPVEYKRGSKPDVPQPIEAAVQEAHGAGLGDLPSCSHDGPIEAVTS